jgi:hypothetical protein
VAGLVAAVHSINAPAVAGPSNRSPRAVFADGRRKWQRNCISQGEEADAGPPLEVLVKAATIVGILLIVLGVIALTYGAITYTREETVIDVGPLEATVERRERIPLPPVLGVLSLAGGIILVVVGARSRT